MIAGIEARLAALFAGRPGLDVVDSHTCGQPTRVILSGAGLRAGMTPAEGRAFLSTQADWVRRVAVLEPRGHRSMFAAALIPPAETGGAWGAVFMDAGAYPDMCGHATIGVATTLCELGLVGRADPQGSGALEFVLHTPAGPMQLTATIEAGRCRAVAFRTPLAYYVGSVELALDHGSPARVDVAWGGQYYAFLPAQAVGLPIEPDAIDALIAAARAVRTQLAARFDLVDPHTGAVPRIGNIVWTAPGADPAAQARNVPVSDSDSFDRSPCGTATCARMAVLVARGELAIGAPFVNESILGTLYRGTPVAALPAPADGAAGGIVPQVQGSAWITAAGRLAPDPADPLGLGYLIGGGPAMR